MAAGRVSMGMKPEVSWYPGDGRLGGNVGDRVLGNDNPPTCTPAR
jgi:hypothetical protein